MQPQIILKDGSVIPLSDDVYELVLGIVKAREEAIEPALSIEEVEAEFADLFGSGPSTKDLLEEHRQERESEERKLQRFR
jgi:hypothetical protein